MAVELGGKKVYFYGADTLEADETKDTVIHYTVSGQSDPSIYVDGKSEVDTPGVDVDTKEKQSTSENGSAIRTNGSA